MILSLYSHILVRLLLRRPFLFLSCFSDSLTFSDGECSDPGGLFPLGFVLFAFLIAFLYFLVPLLPAGFPLLVHILCSAAQLPISVVYREFGSIRRH